MSHIEQNQRALNEQFLVVWTGAMEKAGLCPRLQAWNQDRDDVRARRRAAGAAYRRQNPGWADDARARRQVA